MAWEREEEGGRFEGGQGGRGRDRGRERREGLVSGRIGEKKVGWDGRGREG